MGREQEHAVWMSPVKTPGLRCCQCNGPHSRRFGKIDRMQPSPSCQLSGAGAGGGKVSGFREKDEKKASEQKVP